MNEHSELWNEMEGESIPWTLEDERLYSEWLDQMEQEYLYQKQYGLEVA